MQSNKEQEQNENNDTQPTCAYSGLMDVSQYAKGLDDRAERLQEERRPADSM